MPLYRPILLYNYINIRVFVYGYFISFISNSLLTKTHLILNKFIQYIHHRRFRQIFINLRQILRCNHIIPFDPRNRHITHGVCVVFGNDLTVKPWVFVILTLFLLVLKPRFAQCFQTNSAPLCGQHARKNAGHSGYSRTTMSVLPVSYHSSKAA